MNRDDAIAALRTLEPDLRQQGLAHLYLFGSVARGNAKPTSDVDVAFDIAPAAVDRFSLIDQSRIQRLLASALWAEVDFIERAYLRSGIAQRATADMVQVF